MQGLIGTQWPTVGHSKQDDVDLLPLQDQTRVFNTCQGAISYSCWAILMIGSPPSPSWQSKARFLFWIERSEFHLSFYITRLLPIVMKFVINVIGTKAEWRKGKDILFNFKGTALLYRSEKPIIFLFYLNIFFIFCTYTV